MGPVVTGLVDPTFTAAASGNVGASPFGNLALAVGITDFTSARAFATTSAARIKPANASVTLGSTGRASGLIGVTKLPCTSAGPAFAAAAIVTADFSVTLRGTSRRTFADAGDVAEALVTANETVANGGAADEPLIRTVFDLGRLGITQDQKVTDAALHGDLIAVGKRLALARGVAGGIGSAITAASAAPVVTAGLAGTIGRAGLAGVVDRTDEKRVKAPDKPRTIGLAAGLAKGTAVLIRRGRSRTRSVNVAITAAVDGNPRALRIRRARKSDPGDKKERNKSNSALPD